MSKTVNRIKSVLVMGTIICLAIPFLLNVTAPASQAENYVDWKGGFWLQVPDGWEKVNYLIVDRYLMANDTSADVLNYEAVFAPRSADAFFEDAYFVITFDSTGKLDQRQADSVLKTIAESYSEAVEEAPVVQQMSDLIPGRPQIDHERRVVTVLSEMGYQTEALDKLWLYMQLNDAGLVSLYFYSPDSTFERNQPVFEEIAKSLSFDNLKEASRQELVFTDVSGNEDGPESDFDTGGDENGGGGFVPFLVLILIVLYLIWRFVVRPRMRKNKNRPE